MAPTLTLSGVDERVTQREIERMLAFPDVELGLLCTHDPEGRPRYPELHWLVWAAEIASDRCAIHVCGRRARAALLARQLDDLVMHASRIQVNGVLRTDELNEIAETFATHTIITQHHAQNAALVAAPVANHALLVDASGGTGRRPEGWQRPDTIKPVGFAGGLGPDNLRTQLPLIATIAGDGPFWVDMETSLRIDDWFSPTQAHAAIDTFSRWREMHGHPQGTR